MSEELKRDTRILLDDMRCQAVYTHRVTMSVPLYERIKATLTRLIEQAEAMPGWTCPDCCKRPCACEIYPTTTERR